MKLRLRLSISICIWAASMLESQWPADALTSVELHTSRMSSMSKEAEFPEAASPRCCANCADYLGLSFDSCDDCGKPVFIAEGISLVLACTACGRQGDEDDGGNVTLTLPSGKTQTSLLPFTLQMLADKDSGEYRCSDNQGYSATKRIAVCEDLVRPEFNCWLTQLSGAQMLLKCRWWVAQGNITGCSYSYNVATISISGRRPDMKLNLESKCTNDCEAEWKIPSERTQLDTPFSITIFGASYGGGKVLRAEAFTFRNINPIHHYKPLRMPLIDAHKDPTKVYFTIAFSKGLPAKYECSFILFNIQTKEQVRIFKPDCIAPAHDQKRIPHPPGHPDESSSEEHQRPVQKQARRISNDFYVSNLLPFTAYAINVSYRLASSKHWSDTFFYNFTTLPRAPTVKLQVPGGAFIADRDNGVRIFSKLVAPDKFSGPNFRYVAWLRNGKSITSSKPMFHFSAREIFSIDGSLNSELTAYCKNDVGFCQASTKLKLMRLKGPENLCIVPTNTHHHPRGFRLTWKHQLPAATTKDKLMHFTVFWCNASDWSECESGIFFEHTNKYELSIVRNLSATTVFGLSACYKSACSPMLTSATGCVTVGFFQAQPLGIVLIAVGCICLVFCGIAGLFFFKYYGKLIRASQRFRNSFSSRHSFGKLDSTVNKVDCSVHMSNGNAITKLSSSNNSLSSAVPGQLQEVRQETKPPEYHFCRLVNQTSSSQMGELSGSENGYHLQLSQQSSPVSTEIRKVFQSGSPFYSNSTDDSGTLRSDNDDADDDCFFETPDAENNQADEERPKLISSFSQDTKRMRKKSISLNVLTHYTMAGLSASGVNANFDNVKDILRNTPSGSQVTISIDKLNGSNKVSTAVAQNGAESKKMQRKLKSAATIRFGNDSKTTTPNKSESNRQNGSDDVLREQNNLLQKGKLTKARMRSKTPLSYFRTINPQMLRSKSTPIHKS